MSAIPPDRIIRGPSAHLTSDGRPKLALANRREAKAAAKRARSAHGTAFHVYRCGECPGWHLAGGSAKVES